PAVVAVLNHHSYSFWDWVGPLMPADLHFLRHDGSVILGTVTCDAYAWLEVDDQEFATIAAVFPPEARLGAFDPIDEIDAWLSTYRGDLEWAGELTISENSADEEPWRFVAVSSPKMTATLRLDAHGNLSVSYQHDSVNQEEQHEVSTPQQLQRLFTSLWAGDLGRADRTSRPRDRAGAAGRPVHNACPEQPWSAAPGSLR
ncbi:hypothetical protein, partial [Brooklawnia sp.]|uniref:hypothetical protein n=1 Tax=Brooklawnia sp. TaxID=2699740 RepID=UPI00311EA4EC